MARIQVVISRNGNARIEVSSVKGESCKDLTRNLEKAIGITTEDEATPEFYETNTQTQDQ